MEPVFAALLVGLLRVHYRVSVLYCDNNKFWYCGSTRLSSFTRYNLWVHEGYMPGFNVYMNPLPSQDAVLLVHRLFRHKRWRQCCIFPWRLIVDVVGKPKTKMFDMNLRF
jgi:hypothetical protein